MAVSFFLAIHVRTHVYVKNIRTCILLRNVVRDDSVRPSPTLVCHCGSLRQRCLLLRFTHRVLSAGVSNRGGGPAVATALRERYRYVAVASLGGCILYVVALVTYSRAMYERLTWSTARVIVQGSICVTRGETPHVQEEKEEGFWRGNVHF